MKVADGAGAGQIVVEMNKDRRAVDQDDRLVNGHAAIDSSICEPVT